ncbi:hypothetical protein ACIQPP_05445 [Streptomyces violaceusniger]|uniref:hypothetical protein n=1 Tax=Streptomyces violaceusniger TaxID=68280 RepID=UPI0009975F3B|nr:hypothetical protein [Streptomyces hygroscopicus]AQW55265.1 hypothetical protein SHXM_08728 [Streptomyces hygroscopicus]
MHRTTRTAAEDLGLVLAYWPHLRALVDSSTPGVWPPAAGKSAYLHDDQDDDELPVVLSHPQRLVTRTDRHGRLAYECALCDHVGEGGAHRVRDDRDAGRLAELPAPLRLHVVDACVAVETALCEIADEIAAEVQLAPLPSAVARRAAYRTAREAQIAADDRARRDEFAAADAASPARWSFTLGDRTAVRAALWLLDRLDDEVGPCKPVSDAQRARIALVACEAAQRIERTLGAERRHVPMPDDRPCPWCGAALTMHGGGTDTPMVTCENGFDCGAPVPVVEGRRRWATPQELLKLRAALDAAARRRRRAAARRRQRAAARARASDAA